MDASQVEKALEVTGARLGGGTPIRLFLLGGSGGLLAGLLPVSRTTADVDVVEAVPGESWAMVCEAAAEVAHELGLPASWLNNACANYAYALPLGWKARCEAQRTYGQLSVWVVSRGDFIAAKIVSSPRRPQDIEDLKAMRPTIPELDFADAHIDRVQSESLDQDASFEQERAVLAFLRERVADSGDAP